MKKVAFFTERMKAGFGVDLVVYEIASRLAKRFDLTVFAIEIDKRFVEDAVFKIKKLEIPLAFNPIKQDINSYKYLRNNKNKFKGFDTYVIHTPTFNSWLPYLSSTGKTIVHYYGNSPSSGYKGLKKYRKTIFDTFENLLYFNFANHIISISSFLKSNLMHIHQKKTTVIHLGKEHITKRYEKLSKNKIHEIMKRYYIEPKDIICTYIGRLDYKSNPYKNTCDLIKLQEAIKVSRNKNVKLFAIGLPENNIEEEMYKHGIYVIPMASADELVTILSLSSIYISPSKWEGFNLPLLEAQALGVPVLAYGIGAHPEVVTNNVSGILCEDYDDLENNFLRLLNKPEELRALSYGAKKHSDNFRWDQAADQIANLL